MSECEQVDEIVMVGGSTRIPKVQKMVSEFFEGKELCKEVNPDEVVAEGAAIQAALLSGDPSQSLQGKEIHNVIPLSLGTEIVNDKMFIFVPRNSPIPIRKEKFMYTVHDNQTAIRNSIYEGERANSKDNHFLGKFTLKGLPARPKGKVKELVTFTIDEDGTLNVSALHEETGKKESITLTNNGRLSEAEVQDKIQEAQKFEEQDNAFRARVKAKNDLLDYAYSMRNRARTDSGSLSERDKDRILTEASKRIDWVDANPEASREEYEGKKEQLEFICSPILKAC